MRLPFSPCFINKTYDILITARIRRMTGGYVFTGVCLFTFAGGYPIPGVDRGVPHSRSGWGVPHSRSGLGGYPIPGLDGRYPIPGLDGGGYPIPDVDGGYPFPGGGVPHSRSGWGYPILLMGGTLSEVWTGGYPIPGLDGGRGTPSQVQMGVPYPRSGWGVPQVPPPGQDLMGTSPRSKTGWGTPYPPSGDRSAKRALATWQAVCLLHSRRTFLFVNGLHNPIAILFSASELQRLQRPT